MTRRILFRGISILFGFIVTLVGLEIVFCLLPVNDGVYRLPVNAQNPINRFKENRDFTYSSDWKFSIVSKKHSNNYGFLNDNDYYEQGDTPLMAIIGDSYVEAMQLENRFTMHGILSNKVNNSGRIYSFGMGNTPLSTYLMNAAYARHKFNADSIVFVIVGNDFDQSLSKYERLPGNYYFFPTEDNTLTLKRIDYNKSLARELFRKSAFIRYILFNLRPNFRTIKKRILSYPTTEKYVGNTLSNASEDRLMDSKNVINEFFYQLPLKTGCHASNILFVVDAMRPDIYSDIALKDAAGSYFDIMRNYFMLTAKNKGYEVIDMQAIFISKNRADGSRFEFQTDGHWNALGHRLVADAIESSAVFLRTFNR